MEATAVLDDGVILKARGTETKLNTIDTDIMQLYMPLIVDLATHYKAGKGLAELGTVRLFDLEGNSYDLEHIVTVAGTNYLIDGEFVKSEIHGDYLSIFKGRELVKRVLIPDKLIVNPMGSGVMVFPRDSENVFSAVMYPLVKDGEVEFVATTMSKNGQRNTLKELFDELVRAWDYVNIREGTFLEEAMKLEEEGWVFEDTLNGRLEDRVRVISSKTWPFLLGEVDLDELDVGYTLFIEGNTLLLAEREGVKQFAVGRVFHRNFRPYAFSMVFDEVASRVFNVDLGELKKVFKGYDGVVGIEDIFVPCKLVEGDGTKLLVCNSEKLIKKFLNSETPFGVIQAVDSFAKGVYR